MFGVAVLVLLVAVPAAVGSLWQHLAGIAYGVVVVGLAIALWERGPVAGIDRRAAVLAAIPFINLFAVVPAVWRWTHRGARRTAGRIEPPWGTVGWTIATLLGVACLGGLTLAAYKGVVTKTRSESAHDACALARTLPAGNGPPPGSAEDANLLASIHRLSADAQKSNDVTLQESVSRVLTAEQNLDVLAHSTLSSQEVSNLIARRAATIRALQSECTRHG